MTAWLSPVGWINVQAVDDGILSVQLTTTELPITSDSDLARACALQLREYFAGTRRTFDLPLSPIGTPFQLQVWETARSIPFGATRTYAELASMIGRPGAARAVGNALKRNPIAIIIPCHRILSADGSVGGFAWGPSRKVALLRLERRH